MNPLMKFAGFSATLILMAIIPIYMLVEPTRQAAIEDDYTARALIAATDLYAENCVVCHSPSGAGISTIPALDREDLRSMPPDEIFKLIARGVDGTQMAGWQIEEGGIFTQAEVQDMVALILNPNWAAVEGRVADLGLTPPTPTTMEVTDEMVAAVSGLAGAESLIIGLNIYAQNCAACHAANGAGTGIAPALNTDELRQTPREDLEAVINNGVSGSLMASWQGILAAEELNATLDFILRWPEVESAGVEFPEVEIPVVESSPEMIAAGDRLFHIACKSCHGVDAYGTPMAPSLNNPAFLTETPDAAIYQIIAGGAPDTLMPAWGARLSDQELQSLTAFLRSLESNPGPILQP